VTSPLPGPLADDLEARWARPGRLGLAALRAGPPDDQLAIDRELTLIAFRR
jgi:hypothetical protein